MASKPASKPASNASDRAFADHCGDLLSGLGPIQAQRMFGGWGFKCDGLMVAIIAFDQLYLKVDATTKPQLLAAGGRVFLYESAAKRVEMSYVTAPDEAMEARHFMAPWARLAMEAALRAANAKKPAKKSNPAAAARSTGVGVAAKAAAAGAKAGKASSSKRASSPTGSITQASPARKRITAEPMPAESAPKSAAPKK